MIPHSCLSQHINATIAFFDGEGVLLHELNVGDTLEVQTKTALYTLKVVNSERGIVEVTSDGKFFNEPEEVVLHGSNFGGSMLKVHWVCSGTWMELGHIRCTKTETVRVIKGGVK